MKKLGFLSFGHWTPASQSQARSAADVLLQSIDQLWRETKIADEVHRPLQQLLDHEESLLRNSPVPAEE